VCVCVCSPWTGPSGGIGPLFLWKLPPRSGLFFSQRTLKTRSKVQRVCRADLGRVSRSVSLSMAGDRWVVSVFRGSLSSAIGSGSVWACSGEVQLWGLTLALGYTHTHTQPFSSSFCSGKHSLCHCYPDPSGYSRCLVSGLI